MLKHSFDLLELFVYLINAFVVTVAPFYVSSHSARALPFFVDSRCKKKYLPKEEMPHIPSSSAHICAIWKRSTGKCTGGKQIAFKKSTHG